MDERTIRALLERRAKLQAEIRAIDEEVARRKQRILQEAAAMALSKRLASATLKKVFTNSGRVNVSASKANGDRLIVTANAAGYSIRRLADEVTKRLAKKKITCSPSTITLARKGQRSIRREIVDEIQDLTEFAAHETNWPGGIIEPSEL